MRLRPVVDRLRPFVVLLVAVLLIAFFPHNDSDAPDSTAVAAGEATADETETVDTDNAGPTAAATAASTAGTPAAGRGGAAGSGATRGVGAAAAPLAAPTGAGVGTPEALSGPDCDRATSRIKVPYKYAPPCVRPWPKGADNGGTTSQGVTGDAITIVVVGGGTVDTTRDRSQVEQMWRDLAAIYQHTFETWGRQVKIIWKDFGAASNPNEVQQRAMASEIATLKPFLVLTGGAGGPIFSADLAARKIVSVNANAFFGQMVDLAPYIWAEGNVAEDDIAVAAEYVAKKLMGRPARWAGDPAFQTRPRTFGLVYYEGIEPKYVDPYFAQHGVKLADTIIYNPNPTSFAENARTIIARLKDKGVTTVIDGADFISNAVLTKEATNQLYRPEWLVNSIGGNDITLLARTFDQQQWSHAFGYGATTLPSPVYWREHLINWYWGPDAPAWRGQGIAAGGPNFATAQGVMVLFFTGIHLAGPVLNPSTFRDGMFALPVSGGAACRCITMEQWSFGRQAGFMPGYDDYSAEDDYAEKWWDATSTAPDEVTGTPAPGFYRFVNGGQRVGFGQFSVGEPKAFDPAGTTEPSQTVASWPPNDKPPDYPCEGCPSSNAG